MEDLNETESLLAANRAFYAAFAGGDFGTMEALWLGHGEPSRADEETVPGTDPGTGPGTAAEAPVITCIHPGAPPHVGHAAVMAVWFDLLQAPPAIRCGPARAVQYGATGLVVCIEQIDEHRLAATNVFHRVAGVWRMVHHQAGPIQLIADGGEDGGGGTAGGQADGPAVH